MSEATNRPIVIIESPLAPAKGRSQRFHEEYLDLCMRDSIRCGELPIASHKLFNGPLDDAVPEERELGIELGYHLWIASNRAPVFYLDLGWSIGMTRARARAEGLGLPLVTRFLWR